MEAKDIVQVLAREDFPRVPRYEMFMLIVNEGNTKVIDMLFVPEFAFLLFKAKDRLVAINPKYAAKIDALSSWRPMVDTFRIVTDQFYHLNVDSKFAPKMNSKVEMMRY